MTVKLKKTLKKIVDYLDGQSRLPSASIGEPTDPPQNMHAAVMLSAYSMPLTTMGTSIERRDVIVRIYVNELREPQEEIEFDLDEAVAEFQSDILGDFDLGGDIRSIEPTAMTVTFGYTTVGGFRFRIADILIPMTVDDSATFAK